jgi:geranylgeranyl pyrophosphate synthase
LTTIFLSEVPAELARWADRSEGVLTACLPPAELEPRRLHLAMRYAVLGGGKRIRPALVYACGSALGAPLEALDPPAAAIELVHAYSLVHDDLPAMDDDDFRRGRPTCHRAFDEATAILAGDALQALAFGVLAGAALPARTRAAMCEALARAAGTAGMAGGQALDLAATATELDAEGVERMHRLKTGALIAAALHLGALAADAEAALIERLERFGHRLGLAFQIRDDLLDEEGDPDRAGKRLGKDRAAGKRTFPAVLGREGARMRLREEGFALDEELAAMPAPLATALRPLVAYALGRDR